MLGNYLADKFWGKSIKKKPRINKLFGKQEKPNQEIRRKSELLEASSRDGWSASMGCRRGRRRWWREERRRKRSQFHPSHLHSRATDLCSTTRQQIRFFEPVDPRSAAEIAAARHFATSSSSPRPFPRFQQCPRHATQRPFLHQTRGIYLDHLLF